eukprot:TRINITY_DN1936_c0_g1_i1.p1 TRINITY_DN1936_c0_g1~~TRINITY_DN1936_c0_g1_i1.p1  ORF type:complete len:760 (+),score=230.56 TRINITY_DN1936_c0_g1_i1:104-2281(+)
MTSAQSDFYLHVNEEWLSKPENQIPGEYPRWGGFLKLHDEGLKDQIKLVQSLKEQEVKTEEEVKISSIWEASTLRFEHWESASASYDPIKKELQAMEAIMRPGEPIKDTDDLIDRIATYIHYCEINGITNVFDFDQSHDLENSNNVVLCLGTKGLSLPGREYYFDDSFAEKREQWKQHLKNVEGLLAPSVTLPKDFVTNIVEFEMELAKYKMKNEQQRSYDEYYTNTTMTKLYTEINSLRSLPGKEDNYVEAERDFKLTDEQVKTAEQFFTKLYDLFDFKSVLAANLEKHFTAKSIANPPAAEHITAYDGDAIRRVLAMILNKENFLNYVGFLQYKIVSSFKGFCTKEIDEEYFDFYSRKLHGQEEQKPNDKRTIQIVNAYAGEMLGKVYVAKFFPQKYKGEVNEMILEVVQVMKTSIRANNWLTEATKEKALEKLEKFALKIGFPDVWKDYSLLDIKPGDTLYDISKKNKKWSLDVEFYQKLNSVVDKTEWLITPQTVNAYFLPTQNEVVFPAAILQPPFYCKNKEDIDFNIQEETLAFPDYDFIHAVNFGGIGAVIAHEITHGYDDQGRLFSGDGNLEEWWTEKDKELFTAKTMLMNEQSEAYSFVDGENTYKMNAQLVLGEALADLGGMSLSIQALSARLAKEGASEDLIRANFRVFFKSFANIWKQNAKKDFTIKALTTDPHPPSSFRANLVNNIGEFYSAFDVKEGDPMYIAPEKRLRMW